MRGVTCCDERIVGLILYHFLWAKGYIDIFFRARRERDGNLIFFCAVCGTIWQKDEKSCTTHVRYTRGSPQYLKKSQAIKKRPSRLREKDERKD